MEAMRLPLCIAVFASSSLALARPCPKIDLQPKILTRAGDSVAQGVLVGWRAEWKRMSLPYDEDVAKWTAASKPLTTKELAPGLAILVADPAATAIADKQGKLVAQITLEKSAAKPLAAPTGFTITHTSANPKTTRHVWSNVSATFTAAPPKSAVALVALAGGKPVTYGLVGTERTIEVFGNSTCNPHPAGTAAPAPGQRVQLAWVDSAGRMSKPSTAVKVAGRVAN